MEYTDPNLMPRRDHLDKANTKVRRWTIIVTTLYWAFYTLPWVLVIILSLAGHNGWGWAAVVFTFSLSLWGAHTLAQRRLKKVCEAHPLIFLVKVQEAFGTS